MKKINVNDPCCFNSEINKALHCYTFLRCKIRGRGYSIFCLC